MIQLKPSEALDVLRKHMLVDGFDIVIDLEKSHGRYIKDARDGSEYLDFFSFFATNPLGFNHPKMMDEDFKKKLLRASIQKPSNSDFYTTEMAEFVETFFEIAVPDYFKYVFFIEGGALAVENALKTAFDWKVQKNFEKGIKEEKGHQIIHFKEAFHGRTGYTLSLTNTADPRKTQYFTKFNWPRVLNPKLTFPLTLERLEEVKAAEDESVRQIKEAIRHNPDDIAAIIIEPIQGEGGDNHFRAEFFKELRTLADENEILLIFDEVQTGIGLTGKMWAHEHFGVHPDLMAFGKKTQVCGLLATHRIDEVEHNVFKESSRINSTWGGNLTDMVRSQRYFEIIAEENLVEHAAVTGNYFLEQMRNLEEEFPELIGNIRAKGLLAAFTVLNSDMRDKIFQKAFENKLIILKCGRKSIRFRPPLNIQPEEIDRGFAVLRSIFKSL
ncbi:MAG TPA: L-lysine 6-transaminase [Bacteroidetes bacterium]|nr:L-lysine 6-transaminase [Bacteroidota bacterium]